MFCIMYVNKPRDCGYDRKGTIENDQLMPKRDFKCVSKLDDQYISYFVELDYFFEMSKNMFPLFILNPDFSLPNKHKG